MKILKKLVLLLICIIITSTALANPNVITLPNKSKGLIIFTLTTCPACQNLELYLYEHHVKYTKEIIDQDPIANKLFRGTGLHYVPASFLNGRYIGAVQETEYLEQRGELPYIAGHEQPVVLP